jgi:iron(II)-dependent oxidoreductase
VTSGYGFADHGISMDSSGVRRAGRDLLSLALMDARNRSLQLFAQLEPQQDAARDRGVALGLAPPIWELGYIGWYQEYWIARNMQRALGPRCDGAHARLASALPDADRCWNPAVSQPADRWRLDLPDAAATRDYLLASLESTLELLDKAPDEDATLYFYRLALLHEDQRAEIQCATAQALGLALDMPAPAALAPREPLLLSATRWTQGWVESGFAFDHELAPHPVDIPEFEIDAQPVSWAQYVEFVDDGGYDRPELWLPEGWAWLEQEVKTAGRRGPRHVEQIGVASGAVLLNWFGRPARMSGSQPAMFVNWWEADAWCRWAGRRLPAEVEWEAAAHLAQRRGFVWGGVREWTASTFRAYPGFRPGPDAAAAQDWLGRCKALRGASVATHGRLRHPRARLGLEPRRDDLFTGFRSCAL